jgi:membrane protein YdbS with pleckstrin-like domain
MPLPRKLLTEGESVVIEVRQTWLVLGWPLVLTVLAAVLAVAVVIAVPKAPIGVGYFLLALVVLAGSWLGIRYLKWRTTNIVLTTTRILERRGVLTRQGIEIRLDRINELSYRQAFLERLVRTGSLVVEVGGETGVVSFDYLPHPASLQALVTEQIDALRRSRVPWAYQTYQQLPTGPPPTAPTAPVTPMAQAGPPPGYLSQQAAPRPNMAPPVGYSPGPAQPTVADRLVQLDDLRKRGILSESEFQEKKIELLKQL